MTVSYLHWCNNAFILVFLFSGMRSFEQVYIKNSDDVSAFLDDAENFTDAVLGYDKSREFDYGLILSDKNLTVMGLGRCLDKFLNKEKLEKENNIENVKHKCIKQVHKIMKKENTD